ncbi:hypothetical protein LCGC14_1636430 [marine sediment metagenome]|uniref:J domain-containing protein n=1 Tax=marine sediment metagenome TaxID=412755 RepID=A0A0F9L0K3_9ZZZZ
MRIIIGDRTEQAMKILDIPEYPFTPEELSTKFRSLIKKIHPDINGSNEAKKHSQEVISSYKMLKNLAISNISDKERNVAQKVFDEDEDMFSFYETCPRCKGSKKDRWYTPRQPCFNCNDHDRFFTMDSVLPSPGWRKVRCNQCLKGIFTLRNGRKVTCRRCKGTGIYKIKCRVCQGTGFTGIDKEHEFNCIKCGGTGKIKLDLFNPVIPKGAVL